MRAKTAIFSIGRGFKFIFIVLFLMCLSVECTLALPVPYWIDPDNTVVINVEQADNTYSFYRITNETGYTPNATGVLFAYDDFEDGELSSQWLSKKFGSNEAIISEYNGSLHLAGVPSTASSASVMLNKSFTGAIEFQVLQMIDSPNYGTVSIGNGTATASGSLGTQHWHPFQRNGFMYHWQDLTGYINIRPSENNTTYEVNNNYTKLSGVLSTNTTQQLRYGVTDEGTHYVYATTLPESEFAEKSKISIQTYEGSGQTVHPSVYYNESGVFGYEYWMAITPYPGGNDRYENPCLYASHDGLTWIIPTNISNPIDPEPSAPNHNSDAEIVYNNTSGVFNIYYVEFNGTVSYIKMRTFDNISVSDEYDIVNATGASPAVMYLNNIYHMYSINITDSPNICNYYTSTDGVNFSHVKQINITHNITGKEYWHCDIDWYNNKLCGLFTFVTTNSSGGAANGFIGFADNYGDDFIIQTTPIIINRTSVDANYIYRATFLPNDDKLKVWYSGFTSPEWSLIYCELQEVDNVWKPVNHTTQKHEHLLSTYTNTSRLNNTMYIMLSQGEHSSGLGGNRTIYEFWAYKPSYPEVSLTQSSNNKIVSIKSTSAIENRQVFIQNVAASRSQSLSIERIPFSIDKNSSEVSVNITHYSSSNIIWSESSEISETTVEHIIGGFPASTDIDIYRDGIDYDTVTSNSTGYITWVYDGGFSEHTFEAIPQHAIAGVRNSFANSWSNTVSMVGAIIVIALAGSMIMMFRGKKDLSEVMNDLPGIILIVVLLVTGAIIFGQF